MAAFHSSFVVLRHSVVVVVASCMAFLHMDPEQQQHTAFAVWNVHTDLAFASFVVVDLVVLLPPFVVLLVLPKVFFVVHRAITEQEWVVVVVAVKDDTETVVIVQFQ